MFQIPMFASDAIEAMKSVQAQEHVMYSKYGNAGLLTIRSEEYEELQRLIGIAAGKCSEAGLGYSAVYEMAKTF